MKYVKVAVPDDFDAAEIGGYNVWQPQYTQVLNHGFVGLVDFYGDDSAVVNAARVSYGAGTTKVREDRGLLRYLLRHLHTTPFEMVDFKFHVKAPIFVFRQWHRHRTFSINEYSARYSVMTDEMYLPEREKLAPQSKDNKQGREMTMLSEGDYQAVMAVVDHIFEETYQAYKHLLGPNEAGDVPQPPEAIQRRIQWCKDAAVAAVHATRAQAIEDERPDLLPDENALEKAIQDFLAANGVKEISDEYPGIARELARMVLPVATYSEMYWKGNMWNLMHFLNLRCDGHAQWEIRAYADAIRDLMRPHVEWSMEAWDDYLHHAKRLSRMEVDVVRQMMTMLDNFLHINTEGADVQTVLMDAMKESGASKREITEFIATYT